MSTQPPTPDEPTDAQWQEIDAFIFSGQKIQAIKLYREATNAGLKEAKDIVEAREAQLRAAAPGRFTTPVRRGCLGSIVFLVAAITGTAFIIVKSFNA